MACKPVEAVEDTFVARLGLADNTVAARRLYSVVVEDMVRQNWDKSDRRMEMSYYSARSYSKFRKAPGSLLDNRNVVLVRS